MILKCPVDDIQPLNIQKVLNLHHSNSIAFQRFLILAQLLSCHVPSNKSCQTIFHTSAKKDLCEVIYPFSIAFTWLNHYWIVHVAKLSCSISLCGVYKQKRT